MSRPADRQPLHGPHDGPDDAANHRVDDDDRSDAFIGEIRNRLRATTDGLMPQLTFEEVLESSATGAPPRRTWARAGAIGLAAASLLAVLVWTMREPRESTVSSPSTPPSSPTPAGPVAATTDVPSTETASSSPPSTFPASAGTTVNFLVVGADNGACIDPDSPYVGSFGDRTDLGERSDTIMVIRLDPDAGTAAVLSFPRDLWVPIAGRNSKNRINSAYVRDDPTRLLGTIYDNFGVEVDHYIQIDFCAFKSIVDALDGVAVPFDFPARDKNTGLNVPTTGCFTFDGDHALAYVRSRKYEYQGTDGEWRNDGLADLGRISRQQDFMMRTLHTALDRSVTDPAVARSLIKAVQDNIVVDEDLTLNKMLEYMGLLVELSPDHISSFQIEGFGANVAGNSVLIPQLDSANMRAVLVLFGADPSLSGDFTEPSVSAEASPGAAPEENPKGLVPPRDVTC